MKKRGRVKQLPSCANVKNKELDAIKVCPLSEIDDEDWGYSLPVRRKNVSFFKRDYKMMERKRVADYDLLFSDHESNQAGWIRINRVVIIFARLPFSVLVTLHRILDQGRIFIW